MGGLFRKILIYLCKPIYSLIVYLYKIFYNIATTRFLSSDIFEKISSNIYTLISAVMLFAFSITILSAIVNPDLLSDGKKGVKGVFKRALIAIVLIILVPFAFNELYSIQETVMTNSLIEKIVVGIDVSCDKNDDSCETGGNGGQVIAGTLISSVLYPEEELADQSDGAVHVAANVSEAYEKMVSENIRYIGSIAKNINVTIDGSGGSDGKALKYSFDDDAYAFHFDGLIAVVAGGATLYILVLFTMEIAVRVFKLAFMELTAPISIVAYVAAGDKMLSSWFKELGKTYAELFIRIAAIAFYLFLISNLDSFMEPFSNQDWSFVMKIFLMIGMLIFANQLPELLGSIFGIEIKSKGGIGGMLGSMAGIGKVAQNAWKGLTNVAKAGAMGVAMAPLGGAKALAGKGLRALGNSNTVQDFRQKLSSSKGYRVAGNILGATGRSMGRIGSSMKAAYSAGDGNAIAEAHKAWKDNPAAQTYAAKREQDRKAANERALQRAMNIDTETGQMNDVNFTGASSSVDTLDKTARAHFAADSPEGKVTLDKIQADRRKAIVDSFSSGKEKIINQLQTALGNLDPSDPGNLAARQQLQQFIDQFEAGKINAEDFDTQINSGAVSWYLSDGQKSSINETMDSMYNTFENTDASSELGMSDFKSIFSELKDKQAEFDKKATDAKSNYDAVYEKATARQKETMNNLDRNAAVVNDKYVSSSKKDVPASGRRPTI